MTLARRLLLGSLVVVGVLVVLVVVTVNLRLRGRLLADTAQVLANEARFVGTQWSANASADSLADIAGMALGRRVTLVAGDGRVLGDSEFDDAALRALANHADRPEIAAAAENERGTAQRISTSTGDAQFYVAVPAANGIVRVSLPTRNVDALVRQAQSDVVVAGLVALLVAAFLAYLFSRAVSRPIVELRDVASALAAGDLTRRPSLSAPGEVGDLASALYRMTTQLGDRLLALQTDEALMQAVIESLHEGIVAVDRRRMVVRINESGRRMLGMREPLPFPADHLPRDRQLREALDAALEGAATPAAELRVDDRTLALTVRPLEAGGAVLAFLDLTATRKLETVRRDFVANVSHELKTPLTVVNGFAEALAEDEGMPAEQRRRFVETIRANAQRMHRLVDDLLDLSRIESGGWVPNPVTLEVADVASEVLVATRDAAERQRVRLALEVDPAARTVRADPTALRQILTNLVENAIRYSPGGSVAVFTKAGDAGAWVGVRDTGIGIPAEHLPRIFERFYRVDTGRSREAGGTGLGLAIVRHLAEAHGGRVHVESAVGRGTTIAALFPWSRGARS